VIGPCKPGSTGPACPRSRRSTATSSTRPACSFRPTWHLVGRRAPRGCSASPLSTRWKWRAPLYERAADAHLRRCCRGLPSDDIRVGYYRLVPFHTRVGHLRFPRSTQRFPASIGSREAAGFYITDYLRWFGSYRQAMGGPQWKRPPDQDRSRRVALALHGGDRERLRRGAGPSSTTISEHLQLGRRRRLSRPANTLVVAGVGFTARCSTTPICTRAAVVPITDRIAVQLAAVHNSINADMRATVGLRFNWSPQDGSDHEERRTGKSDPSRW